MPFATSNAAGEIAFSVESSVPAGCGTPRCFNLRFDGPGDQFASTEIRYTDANKGDVVLAATKGGGGGAGQGGAGGSGAGGSGAGGSGAGGSGAGGS
jgi:hypothetical protein